MFRYLIVFIIQVSFILVYLKIADHLKIIDKPNGRSSHTHVTIRGGGIVFPFATLLWFLLFGYGQPWIIWALLLISVISFYDDMITLESKLRFIIQISAVSVLFWQLHVLELPWYAILLAYLLTVGWINAFNFMDGINGITAIYSLVALVTFAWLNYAIHFIPQQLVVILILSVLIFSVFNIRKYAKTFAGDVGSISMAFLLVWFMISLMLKTGRVEYILCFAIYGIDSVFTILFRLRRRENIFKAHRTHLYQHLCNELKYPHVLVSSIYGFVQLGINVVTIWLISTEKMTWSVFSLFVIVLSAVYLIVRFRVSKMIQLKIC